MSPFLAFPALYSTNSFLLCGYSALGRYGQEDRDSLSAQHPVWSVRLWSQVLPWKGMDVSVEKVLLKMSTKEMKRLIFPHSSPMYRVEIPLI